MEFLALKWVVEKFHDYLAGAPFMVYTDNNPLAHLHTAKLDGVTQRWAAHLANYNFKIKYRPGRQNSHTDALSSIAKD